MNNIKILDCTLRDGGYCNDWNFGFDNEKKIIQKIKNSDIDLIECGFLTNKKEYDKDHSVFNELEQIKLILPPERSDEKYVVMMNYGEYNVDILPYRNDKNIDGIRIAFHKKNMADALDIAKRIKEKGYLVFIQAMVSLNYTNEEFIDLINLVNEVSPYAFYIVDSFGCMKEKDLLTLYNTVDKYLNKEIIIGFHSHNNMQLAYSNALKLIEIANRDLIIDTSVYGMGRGAGNLNTELFIESLNEKYNKNYKLDEILVIIDEVLNDFYEKKPWGYSLPNYISAFNNVHPNYANFLDEKKTLTIKEMNDIIKMIPEDKKVVYDKICIDNIYKEYMSSNIIDTTNEKRFIDTLKGKNVVLIAPGKSAYNEFDKIKSKIEKDDIVISVNFEYDLINTNFIFLSNLRRYRELSDKNKNKLIVSSNIKTDNQYLRVKYEDLINNEPYVNDNAGLMAIKLLINKNVKNIYLVGFDGYSHETNENYGKDELEIKMKNEYLDNINNGMNKMLQVYNKKTNIEFLTKRKYLII